MPESNQCQSACPPASCQSQSTPEPLSLRHLQTGVLGDLGELSFDIQCLKRGLEVTKPIGDNLPYDRIVHSGGNFSRVQVKTANQFPDPRTRGVSRYYSFNFAQYAKDSFDTLVLYMVDDEQFVVIPWDTAFKWNSKRVRFKPTSTRIENYLDAWHLLCIPSKHG